jgi:GNAT superfamily N-acetyltransferase
MNELNIVIERVTDIDAYWHEILPLWKGQGDYHQPLHGWAYLDDWEQRLRSRLKGGDDELVLIARVEGEPAGFLNATIRRPRSVWDYTHCYVDNVFVVQGQRGSGISRLLLEQAESWSKSRGVYEMELIAMANNDRAIAVWRHLGFDDQHIGMRKTLERDS